MTEYKKLTDEELIRRLRMGETGIIDYLMEKYKNLVRKEANAMYLLGGETDDLIQEGMIGLFKAVQDYDVDQEASFFSFARLCVTRQLYSAIEASNRKKHSPLNSYISLYEREDGENSLIDTMESGHETNPEELLVSQEHAKSLEERLEKDLSELERRVLYLHLMGTDYKTIAKLLDRSPKTIDNDLALTDHTPGYGSAAKYIGTSMKEIIRDSFCLEYEKGVVSIVEIMGRNAGWLTGAAALSKGEDCEGPDLIYLPELPFDLQLFGEKIKQLLQEKTSIVVAVSEGIRTEDGTYVCELGNSIDFVDAFGHKQLSGTASYLASYIAGEIGCKTRAIELSTLQRAASHAASRVDILEAYQVGGAAVKAADEGDTGKMVVLKRLSDDPYQCGTEVKDVHKIANDEKLVPRNWVNEEGTYVTNEFISYVRPLIQGDVSPVMVDGIPRHLYTPKELSHR